MHIGGTATWRAMSHVRAISRAFGCCITDGEGGCRYPHHMRAMFVFLRVVASLISMSLVALGALYAVLACWLVWQLPGSRTALTALVAMVGFGGLMIYLGARVLLAQGRMFAAWWQEARRARGLPEARLVLR